MGKIPGSWALDCVKTQGFQETDTAALRILELKSQELLTCRLRANNPSPQRCPRWSVLVAVALN